MDQKLKYVALAILCREGILYLEFAATLPGSGAGSNQFGNKSYAWADKITWGMGVNEISAWLSNPNKEHKFFHDPSKCAEVAGFRVLGVLGWQGLRILLSAGVVGFKGAGVCCCGVLGSAGMQGLRL